MGTFSGEVMEVRPTKGLFIFFYICLATSADAQSEEEGKRCE